MAGNGRTAGARPGHAVRATAAGTVKVVGLPNGDELQPAGTGGSRYARGAPAPAAPRGRAGGVPRHGGRGTSLRGTGLRSGVASGRERGPPAPHGARSAPAARTSRHRGALSGPGRCAAEREADGRWPDEEGLAEPVRRRHGVSGRAAGRGGRRAGLLGRPGEGSEGRRSPRRHAADGLFTPRAGLWGSRAAGGRAAPGGLEPEDPAVEGCDTEEADRVAPGGAGSEPGHGARAPTTRAGSAPATIVPMSS